MSKLMANLLADERRQMYQQTTSASSNIPSYGRTMPNEKYMAHIQQPQAIRENIGILYNNDSLAQLDSKAIAPLKISHAGGANLDMANKYVVINSGDRDWINRTDESPYRYTVDIGGSSQANGRNINITVNSALENVYSIKCEGLVLTNRAHTSGFKPSNQPFIMVNLEAVNDVVLGSNKYLDNSLAQMVTKIPFPVSLDNIRYVQLVNQGQTQKIFQTPEAKIGKMTISINRANGTNINGTAGAQLDVVGILRAVYTPGSPITQTLAIITTNYFSGLDWQLGDTIQIRNYAMRGSDDPTNSGFYERIRFNGWMNREEGHIIYSVGSTTGSTQLYNIINITAPGDWSTSTGNYELYTWFDDLVTKTEIDFDSGTDAGKALNENLQTVTFLTCEVLEKNSLALLRDIKGKI